MLCLNWWTLTVQFQGCWKMKFAFFKQRCVYSSSCCLVHNSLNKYNTTIGLLDQVQINPTMTRSFNENIRVWHFSSLNCPPCSSFPTSIGSAPEKCPHLECHQHKVQKENSWLWGSWVPDSNAGMWYKGFVEGCSESPGLQAMSRHCGMCLL